MSANARRVDDRVTPATHYSATTRLPKAPGSYAQFEVGSPPMLLAAVGRDDVATLSAAIWSVPGVYFLLGPDGDEGAGALQINVGKAPTRVRERLVVQRRNKEWWGLAVAVVSGASVASALWCAGDTAWLERALYHRLQAEQLGRLDNQTTPPDCDLDRFRVEELSAVLGPCLSVLTLFGLPQVTDVGIEDDDGNHDTGAPRTWLECARAVLRDASPEGLTVHEIVQRIHAAGLRDPAATRSPEQTLFRDLREATRPGRDGPFRRTSVKPLCYGLHDVTPRAG